MATVPELPGAVTQRRHAGGACQHQRGGRVATFAERNPPPSCRHELRKPEPEILGLYSLDAASAAKFLTQSGNLGFRCPPG